MELSEAMFLAANGIDIAEIQDIWGKSGQMETARYIIRYTFMCRKHEQLTKAERLIYKVEALDKQTHKHTMLMVPIKEGGLCAPLCKLLVSLQSISGGGQAI